MSASERSEAFPCRLVRLANSVICLALIFLVLQGYRKGAGRQSIFCRIESKNNAIKDLKNEVLINCIQHFNLLKDKTTTNKSPKCKSVTEISPFEIVVLKSLVSLLSRISWLIKIQLKFPILSSINLSNHYINHWLYAPEID